MTKLILESNEQTLDVVKQLSENELTSYKEILNLLSIMNNEYSAQIESINERIDIDKINRDKAFNKIKKQLNQAPNR